MVARALRQWTLAKVSWARFHEARRLGFVTPLTTGWASFSLNKAQAARAKNAELSGILAEFVKVPFKEPA